ncbi:oxidoreductase [Companilactobacillus tucceti DSM 20183]|uniref:Oxidoreductase n=1 Tax=Companilactobacillus tucceti DSM 20183 TaxID=1423811 RepID=A0A0R1J2A6_9LACO|nr:NAD(P)H-binding protein [Companilactobacillus tucceti]KRK65445.1 oxidoreductase [Companilactobacillus tucceti DSM 20183]
MKKVLIIGATGTVGSKVRQTLLKETDDRLTLFSRRANELSVSNREETISGDVTNDSDLDKAVSGQDVVFVALSGNLSKFAKKIISAMNRNHVDRLIFITSMGIYNEIPASIGASGNLQSNPMLQSYRDAADLIESSDLNYTIIRPGWFNNGPVDYQVTKKGEPFGGHDVSVSSIADMVKKLIDDDSLYSHDSIGLNTPE